MLFNSFEYALFFPLFVFVYFLLKKQNHRIVLTLFASYTFYMCWEPYYILLIFLSTIIDYTVGYNLDNTEQVSKRKALLACSIIANLGILFFFKYYNFTCNNLQILINTVSTDYEVIKHNFLLPVGISFYTFQTLSYTLDIYTRKQKAEKNFLTFALYVSYFPQLVAGPIERSTNLIPQLKKKIKFDYERVSFGLKLILWGLFKKIVIADRFAIYSDTIFNNPGDYSGLPVLLGVIFFTFQIYCDFSGYSDIAIGSAKVLGIKLMDNFKGPYFSKSIQEFWRRWHISLSTWFRDYVYIPLGGNRKGSLNTYRNLCLVFLVTGIWHGAAWTFLFWGMFHGLFLIIERLGFKKILDKMPTIVQLVYTFTIASVGWVFFRASSFNDALTILSTLFLVEDNFLSINILSGVVNKVELYISIILLLLMIPLQYLEYKHNIIRILTKQNQYIRWLILSILLISLPILGEYGNNTQFIYFQF